MNNEPAKLKVRVPGAGSVGRAYRQTMRLKDVLAVLVRNGFGDVVDAIRSDRRHGAHRTPTSEEVGKTKLAHARTTLTRAERVRTAIEELGPTYVKLGQILSTRPDLVPAEFLAELAKLQDDVPPFPFDEVRETVEREMGAALEETFEAFEVEALASASLGQVHRARFQGRDVAVKVQRPGVRQVVTADIDLMMQLASLLEDHVEGWDVYEPTRVVKEFADTIQREMDYQVEAAHQERFARQFADDSTIFVPKIYREASTACVLTMDYVDGVKVTDLDGLEAIGANRAAVASRGFRLVLEQALMDGFFHADPHPGNIFVLPGDVVCFIDFGMMGRLSQKVREEFVELVQHIVDEDPARVTRTILRMTNPAESVDATELEREVADFLDLYLGRPLGDLDLTGILREILQALARHKLRVPPDLYLMLKAISEIESLAVALDPDFDLVSEAKPYVQRIFMERFKPRRLADDLTATGREIAQMLRDAPDALRDLSDQARSGRLRIHLEQERVPEILKVSDRIGNRIAFAFVLGSSLVGSAIVAAADIPPLWRGISLLGLGGFVVSLVMSFWLLISILRHGRL